VVDGEGDVDLEGLEEEIRLSVLDQTWMRVAQLLLQTWRAASL